MTSEIPKPAKILGFLGLLPFLIALFSTINANLYFLLVSYFKININELQIIYSTIILCFMSGTYWGISSNAKNQDSLPYTLSILPTLYILGIHLYFDEYFLPLIGFGFILLIPIDIYFSKSKMAPKWWLLLRIPLSVTVFGILIIYSILK